MQNLWKFDKIIRWKSLGKFPIDSSEKFSEVNGNFVKILIFFVQNLDLSDFGG